MKQINYEFYLKVTNSLKNYVLNNPNTFTSASKIHNVLKFDINTSWEIRNYYNAYHKGLIDLRRLCIFIFIKKYWKNSVLFINYNGDKCTGSAMIAQYIQYSHRIHDKERIYALEKFMAQ